MPNKIKNEFKFKIIIIIVYFFINTMCFSFLFFLVPRSLLLNEKEELNKIKLILFKDFAKDIYENIKTPLIKNFILTDFESDCPKKSKPLAVKNQYYGNFTKLYDNKKICIERFSEEEYSFQNLLKTSDIDFYKKNKKKCGKLAKNSSIDVYVEENMNCPLNKIEINSKTRAELFGSIYYQIGQGDEYIIPVYGNDPGNPVISNIEIINNYKVCLEKFNSIKELPCEFPDHNECFIKDNYDQIYSITHDDNMKFYPTNLAKWNLINDKNIEHKFCKDDLNFHMFTVGYINMTKKNLEEFEEEFPPNDLKNNTLYKSYKAYKSSKNIDNLFYLITIILLVWSLTHFIIQTMIYFYTKKIRTLYITNGIVLILFKLISLFGMIINHFCFFLKIEKIYLVLEDNSRNEIINTYFSTRRSFIIKIVLICFFGFVFLSIDFIISIFSYRLKLGIKIEINYDVTNINIHKSEESFNPNDTNSLHSSQMLKIDKNFVNQKTNSDEEKNTNINSNSKISSNKRDSIDSENAYINNNLNQITLKFIYKDNLYKSYVIKIEKDKPFNNAVQLLKEKYSELKEKEMKIFQGDSNIINKEKTIDENGLSDDKIIYIL